MTGTLVWITGLPASGKSTLAELAQRQLMLRGQATCVLDGDALRDALVPTPGYAARDRDQFYQTLANLGAMLTSQGLIVLIAATGHKQLFRSRAAAQTRRFVEVYVDTPIDLCRQHDRKGLYAGDTTTLPGKGVAYQPPHAPDIIAHGGRDSGALAQLIARCIDYEVARVSPPPRPRP